MMRIGRPKVNFINHKMPELVYLDISLSHCRDFAVAFVIAKWKGE